MKKLIFLLSALISVPSFAATTMTCLATEQAPGKPTVVLADEVIPFEEGEASISYVVEGTRKLNYFAFSDGNKVAATLSTDDVFANRKAVLATASGEKSVTQELTFDDVVVKLKCEVK